MGRYVASSLVVLLAACGANGGSAFVTQDPGVGSVTGDGGSTGPIDPFGAEAGSETGADGGGTVTVTTIYANTDDSLYTLDPATNAVTLVGKFTGATTVTDCAVDAAGDVFLNTTTAVYKAALPAGGTGNVVLTKVASIAASGGAKFYALAFAPAGVLGASETLVGGDGNGELWSIDPGSGATKDLGSFGPDGTNVFGLSGDLVFYLDGAGKPTGLATIRSCKPGGTSCTTTNDYLAGIDMTALAAAFTSGTPAASLLSGIYGGSASSKGAGVGHGDVFGLGAWEGNVYGFERASANGGVPAMLAIDTKTGSGTILPSTESFTNGWSGACVTTKVTVTVPPPPPAPH